MKRVKQLLVSRRAHASVAPLPTRSAWFLLGVLYAAAGGLVISTTFFPAAAPDRIAWVVQVMDGAALVSAVVLLLGAGRLPRQALGPVVFLSSVLITVCVLCSGGHSTAVAYACVYFVAPVYCRFVLTRRQADVQLLLILAMGVPALMVQPGVTAGEQMVVWGIAMVQTRAVTWLVGALQRAETDSLTGLPNRRGLERFLEEALRGAADGRVGLVLLDLDHFRSVNEALGRGEGDRVLATVAGAWRVQLPATARIGRVSGDGFAVVLPGADLRRTTAVADALRLTTAAATGCSAGTVGYELGESASMLLARAESAVYTAKHQGRGRTYEHPGTGQEGQELRTALLRQEFVVHLQPIVDVATHAVVGAEALVRWQHPERGLLLPGAFLAEVERCGLISQLGAWMLHEACQQANRWPLNAQGDPIYLSVNASGPELLDGTYAATVESALMGSGLSAERLVVELVESDYDTASPTVLGNLERLRTLGVRTAIDDFGVGHSSLDRLRRTGSSILKIDRSFVSDITDADAEAPLVLAVLALGHALGMRVVAEGVETTAQATWLHRHGCELAQGWLFGAAQPNGLFVESARELLAAVD